MFGASVERLAVAHRRNEQMLHYIGRRLRAVEDRLDLLDSGGSSQTRRAALDKIAAAGPILFRTQEMATDEAKEISDRILASADEIARRWDVPPAPPIERVQNELSVALQRIAVLEARLAPQVVKGEGRSCC